MLFQSWTSRTWTNLPSNSTDHWPMVREPPWDPISSRGETGSSTLAVENDVLERPATAAASGQPCVDAFIDHQRAALAVDQRHVGPIVRGDGLAARPSADRAGTRSAAGGSHRPVGQKRSSD